ncbi:MAG TPA: 2-keto-4-pentenoate hydratase [Pseudomonas xinjiangensis]|uniref:2-keto-4-pentenoate hydratase n=2 Tax=root TaxID=1 RepID=A0A7V1BPS9_9GAMM|nr:2-keto-4-pentenoate hydratase [Halopseudomonas xinjiangensis]HEC47313.1 2-keto-4-pentenoate hydratase [Halopseudomonas xinjiangensis]
MNSIEFDADSAAKVLFKARQTRQPCESIAGPYGMDSLEKAQLAQQALLNMYRRAGQEQIGFKLGLTDFKAQKAMGLEQPLVGVLLQNWQYWDGDEVPFGQLNAPRVEAEVAFIFGQTLDDPELDEQGLLKGLAGVLPALEICDSAFQGWPRHLFDAVADNLSSGLFVLGANPIDPARVDFAGLKMSLYINNAIACEGSGTQCMGSPLAACLWLTRHLAAQGTPVQAGDILLSGALGPMQPASLGDSVRMDCGELGEVSCRFA